MKRVITSSHFLHFRLKNEISQLYRLMYYGKNTGIQVKTHFGNLLVIGPGKVTQHPFPDLENENNTILVRTT